MDTGPLVLPDFNATVDHAIECFEMAHIGYHTLDKAEFILRKSVPSNAGGNPDATTTDYSWVQIMPAHHDMLASK